MLGGVDGWVHDHSSGAYRHDVLDVLLTLGFTDNSMW